MLKSKRFLPLGALLLALGLIAGCGGDDGAANPETPTLQLDAAMAEEFTVEALDMVNEIVAAVPDLAAGDMGSMAVRGQPLAKSMSDSLEWDAGQQAWTFAFDGPLFELAPPNHWLLSVDMWVQYRNAEGPLQYPLGATQMQVRYGLGMDVHQEEGGELVDLEYDTQTDMTVSFLGQETYGVEGSGSATYDVMAVTSQGTESGRFGMEWTVDVTASAGGCPTGTATVMVQQWTLAAEYDGQGGVAWTLTGPDYQATGSDELPCGQPVF